MVSVFLLCFFFSLFGKEICSDFWFVKGEVANALVLISFKSVITDQSVSSYLWDSLHVVLEFPIVTNARESMCLLLTEQFASWISWSLQ